MKKSSRFVVAVHLLALLGSKKGEYVTSEQLAQSVNTNPAFVRRILRMLAENNLVEAKEGKGGGARLAWAAAAIDLREVYEAVEQDSLVALPTNQPNENCPVGRAIGRALKPTLVAAELAFREALGETKVADVVLRIQAESP